MLDENDIEFDIQKTILKKKQNKNSKFYVEYDRLTNQVVGVTPDKITPGNVRHTLLEVDESKLIKSIFENRIPLHKLKVRYDYATDTRTLFLQRELSRYEFDYIRSAKPGEDNFIHLHCDVVAKKINVNFIENIFMHEFTKERISEITLSELPKDLSVYCIDRYEPSRLFDTININFKKLFSGYEQRFSCVWLPDDAANLNQFDFVHYNHNVRLSVDKEPFYIPIGKVSYKPTIIYKQSRNKLQIQSAISESKNFHLDSEITFYLFDPAEPSVILDTITVNSSDLDNFNMLEFKIKTTKKVKMISNYSHLYIEDSNVSSYYQF
jgi:hypothetical protein